jgi:hypothetical protein
MWLQRCAPEAALGPVGPDAECASRGATVYSEPAVEAERLTVKDGAATVNATQAQLKDMAKKPKS